MMSHGEYMIAEGLDVFKLYLELQPLTCDMADPSRIDIDSHIPPDPGYTNTPYKRARALRSRDITSEFTSAASGAHR